MTWSYDSSLTQDRDQVRFLVGDTATANQLVQNEEIDWALTQGGIWFASSLIADSVAGKFSDSADKQVGDLRLSNSQKSKQFRDLAANFRSNMSRISVAPYFGGLTESGKDVDEDNTDLVAPFFRRDLMDTQVDYEQEA